MVETTLLLMKIASFQKYVMTSKPLNPKQHTLCGIVKASFNLPHSAYVILKCQRFETSRSLFCFSSIAKLANHTQTKSGREKKPAK
jgi:hypothetical protein